MAQAKRDENRVPTLLAVSSADGTTPVVLYADPTTHRLYVDLPGGSSGTVTTVSVVTANGISGTVANATTTPAITLTLGAITPSSVNGVVISGTSTPTLAVTGTTAVSGTNTGDQDLSGYVTKATYDANTILYATTDNTPVALTVTEQTVVGRATGGAISALAIDSDLSSVSANDNTVPSAKATKAYADTKLSLAGGTMTGDITLGENASIALDPAGSADGKYSGTTITGTAGTTVAFGDLVYLSSVDSRWELADADAATTSDRMVAMCLGSSTDGNPIKLLLQGVIRADAKFPALTIGSAVYVGETAGEIQVAIPTGADNVIRRVGYALTADEIYFNPSMDSQITVA